MIERYLLFTLIHEISNIIRFFYAGHQAGCMNAFQLNVVIIPIPLIQFINIPIIQYSILYIRKLKKMFFEIYIQI
jgi:hypothetical protein